MLLASLSSIIFLFLDQLFSTSRIFLAFTSTQIFPSVVFHSFQASIFLISQHTPVHCTLCAARHIQYFCKHLHVQCPFQWFHEAVLKHLTQSAKSDIHFAFLDVVCDKKILCVDEAFLYCWIFLFSANRIVLLLS